MLRNCLCAKCLIQTLGAQDAGKKAPAKETECSGKSCGIFYPKSPVVGDKSESAAEYPDIARLMSEIYAKKMNRDGEQKALEGMSKKSIEAAARKEGMEQVNSNLEGTHRM